MEEEIKNILLLEDKEYVITNEVYEVLKDKYILNEKEYCLFRNLLKSIKKSKLKYEVHKVNNRKTKNVIIEHGKFEID